MSKMDRKLRLKVALLLEDYSEKELLKAIDSFKDCTNTANKGSKKSKPFDKQQTLIINKITASEPEKGAVLQRFDDALRRKDILQSFSELKSFGIKVDKRLGLCKSRNAIVPKLIVSLSDLPIEKVKRLIEQATTQNQSSSSTDYLSLANYIIAGSDANSN